MPREAYKHAMEFFVTTVSKIHDDQWDLPGLGEWTVRDLVGHTARAMLTVAQFAAPSSDSSAEAEQATAGIPTPAAYYQRAFVGEGTNARIAERGRQTGASLGPVLPAAVSLMSTEIASLIDTLSDDHVFATLIGGIRLVDYLPTRTVELVVHTLDLQEATGIEGDPPRDAMLSTLHLLAELAVDTPDAGHLARLATGRDAWNGPFSVLG
jgi:uncharacterized protein (TIGR03083 family)